MKAPVEHPSTIFRAIDAQLETLGYALAWQASGNADIIIEDYPKRPVTDYFRLRYITPPVGYANPSTTEHPAHYYFEAPRFLTGTLEGLDIRPGLTQLESRLADFCQLNALGGEAKRVLPTLHVLEGNVERTRRCMEAGIHPKWLADALAFGISFEDAVELRDVPPRRLYRLFA